MEETPLHNKKLIANQLFRKGFVFIHLDPRVEGVVVPPWFKHQAQLVLQFGLDMPIPIPDLLVEDEVISGTLSFSRTPFHCIVPWKAVFAVVGNDNKGQVWHESMPAEVLAEVNRMEARQKKTYRDNFKINLPQDSFKTTGLDDNSDDDYSEPFSAPRKVEVQKLKKSGKVLPPYLRVIK
jgi:hypothetical protein